MKSILPLSLSVYLIALLTKPTVAKGCAELKNTASQPIVSCTDINLQDIPQNFSKTIKSINFVRCNIMMLTSKSFSIYPNITAWTLDNSTIEQISEKTFLLPLKKLEVIAVLNPYNLTLSHFPEWILPPSTQRIYYPNNNLKTINFADQNLPLLKILYLTNNSLTSFPILEPTFTLLELELSGNPDMEVTVEHLFPLCKLEKFFFDPKSNTKTRLTKTWTICHCLRLKIYLEIYKIQNDFDGYSCGNASIEKCSLNFDGKYTPDDVRRVCLPRIFKYTTSTTTKRPMVPEERNDTWLIKAFGIFFLLLLLMGTLYTILAYLWRNKETKQVELESTADMTWEENEENEENEEESLPDEN